MAGSSRQQGPHETDQTNTKVVLPLKSARVQTRPALSGTCISGKGRFSVFHAAIAMPRGKTGLSAGMGCTFDHTAQLSSLPPRSLKIEWACATGPPYSRAYQGLAINC